MLTFQLQYKLIYRTNVSNSRTSKSFTGICDSVPLCVCVCVCPHDKTKTKPKQLKVQSPNLTHMITHPSINIRSKGQRSRSQGHKVQKSDQVASIKFAPLSSAHLVHYCTRHLQCFDAVLRFMLFLTLFYGSSDP